MNELGVYVGAESTRLTNGEYLNNIQVEIDKLTQAMNDFKGNNNPQLKGYIAEVWHTYTFNINATANRSTERASMVNSNKLGSVDVTTSWGEDYSLKYYKDGASSAMAQGHPLEWAYQRYIHSLNDKSNIPNRRDFLSMNGIDPNTDMMLGMYEGQARLIPSDQIKDAIAALDKQISKELNNLNNPDREQIAKILQDVKSKLTDHLSSPAGDQSMPLTEDMAKELAILGKEGKFDPRRYDITAAKQADIKHICTNIFNAGLNAAWVSALIKMLPDIYKLIKNMINDGKLREEDLFNIGKSGLSGGIQGFALGTITASITTYAEMGELGDTLKALSMSKNFAPAVSTIAVFAVQAICDSYKLAKGKMSEEEFAVNTERNLYIACGGIIGGLSMQLIWEVPVFSYALGSLIGSILGGFIFTTKEHIMMSLCVKGGYTVFGLVKQDYSLPKDVRKKLGYDVYGISDYEYEKYTIAKYNNEKYQFEHYKKETIDAIILKRGVISCRKIGYTL